MRKILWLALLLPLTVMGDYIVRDDNNAEVGRWTDKSIVGTGFVTLGASDYRFTVTPDALTYDVIEASEWIFGIWFETPDCSGLPVGIADWILPGDLAPIKDGFFATKFPVAQLVGTTVYQPDDRTLIPNVPIFTNNTGPCIQQPWLTSANIYRARPIVTLPEFRAPFRVIEVP